jgi:hypothetical protein
LGLKTDNPHMATAASVNILFIFSILLAVFRPEKP